MCQEHIYSRYDSFKLPFAEAAIVNLIKNYIMDQGMLSRTSWHKYPFFFTIIMNEFTSQKIKSMSETPNCVFLFDIVDELAIIGKETQVDIREKYFSFHLPFLCKILLCVVIFVSPAKQKRDICTAFPAASLSSSSSSAA